jgi:predicted 2-oxoglutarate/Fe(II)-dependent dioxygenase YbiX
MCAESHKLLERLGLYVNRGFLPAAICRDLVGEMLRMPNGPATVTRETTTAVDVEVRRTLSVEVSAGAAAAVARALDGIRPELERHFGLALTSHESPHYLLYDRDAFFVAHRDRPRRGADELAARRISVVLFLNHDFSGGALTFYDLIAGPGWEGIGLPCPAAAGLLVAFRSETMHEVQPVTAGQRCTIVSWYC